jgi:hypothetical protein
VTTFLLLALMGETPRSTYFQSWEEPTQFLCLVAAVIGVAIAWRWAGPGALLMLIGGAGLGALAAVQYHPLTSLFAALAFIVPGTLFVLYWQLTKPIWHLAVLAAILVATMAAGGYTADRVHDYYFGPTHPESPLEALPVDVVDWIWAGAVSEDSVTVNAHLAVDAEAVRLLVSEDEGLSKIAARTDEAVVTDAANDRIASFVVDGLEPDTRYWYAVEADGHVDTVRQGVFRTLPAGPATFTIAFGSCARSGSNGSVFDTIRSHDPLMYLITGDFHYSNISENSQDPFRDAFRTALTRPAQAALYASTSVAYVWDDHDYGGNNADATSNARPAATAVYRQVVPHYDLPAASAQGPVYQAFTVGRLRFLLTDTRSARTPASAADNENKTMLGNEQKSWFFAELLAARDRDEMIVWVNPDPWIDSAGAGKDTWGGYATERREIANFIRDNGLAGRLLMLSGDAHMLGIDDGTNSDYADGGGAGFPVMHAAALDRRGSIKGGPYSEGAFPGGGQFGLMTVTDEGGPTISIALSGRNWQDAEIVSYTFDAALTP